jgi:CRP-like cAMP-binding protein
MAFSELFFNSMNLSETSELFIDSIVLREELPKGHILFREGDVCRRIYYIEKGIARVYYNLEGKEVTAWFSAENSFLTAIDSFSQNIPTHDTCELLEPSVIYSVDYDQLDTMLKEHPEIARIAFYVVIELLKRFSSYVTNTKFQSAKERFETLITNYPTIFLRASLGDIASYLGITQETLSRIRAQK